MLFSKKIIGSLNRPKTSAAEAEGRLLKSFGIGRLCSASVIVCNFVSLPRKLHHPNFHYIQKTNYVQWLLNYLVDLLLLGWTTPEEPNSPSKLFIKQINDISHCQIAMVVAQFLTNFVLYFQSLFSENQPWWPWPMTGGHIQCN